MYDQKGRELSLVGGKWPGFAALCYSGEDRLPGGVSFRPGQDRRFRIDVPRRVRHHLRDEVVEADTYRFIVHDSTLWLDKTVALRRGGVLEDVLIEVWTKLDVRGQLRVRGSRQNFEGLSFRIKDHQTGKESHPRAKVEEDGTFRLPALLIPGRHYTVEASLARFRGATTTLLFDGAPKVGPIECGEAELAPAGRISGRALVGGQQPQDKDGFSLRLEGVGHSFSVFHSLLPEGHFSFKRLPMGRYRLTLSACERGFAWRAVLEELVLSEGNLELNDLVIDAAKLTSLPKSSRKPPAKPAVAVVGRLLASDGEPVPGGAVELVSKPWRQVGVAVTDERGQFHLEAPPGVYRVRGASRKPDAACGGMVVRDLILEEGKDRVELDLALQAVDFLDCTVVVPEGAEALELVSLSRSLPGAAMSTESLFLNALHTSSIRQGRCKAAVKSFGENHFLVAAKKGGSLGFYPVSTRIEKGAPTVRIEARRVRFYPCAPADEEAPPDQEEESEEAEAQPPRQVGREERFLEPKKMGEETTAGGGAAGWIWFAVPGVALAATGIILTLALKARRRNR